MLSKEKDGFMNNDTAVYFVHIRRLHDMWFVV